MKSIGRIVEDFGLSRLLILAAITGCVLGFPRTTFAAPPVIIVGDGTVASCTEFALQDALSTSRAVGGGTIKLRCGAAPATILLSTQGPMEDGNLVMLDIPDRTTIDGEGKITLTNTNFGEDSVIAIGPAARVMMKN